MRHAIDVVGLPHDAGLDAVVIDAIDDRANRAAESLLVPLGRDEPLQLVQPLESLALHVFGHVVGHLRGARSLLRANT